MKNAVALRPNQAYRNIMAETKKKDFENSTRILDEESDATLALLKQRLKSSDKNRSVPSNEVRQRMKKWLTKSSITKTR